MGFAHSILFAVAAAAGLPVAVFALGSIVGTTAAVAAYAAITAVAYVVAIAPTRRAGLAAASLAAVLIGGLLLMPLRLATFVAGAAVVLAVCRSALLYRSRPLRAVLLESSLVVGGLGLAGFLAGHDLPSLALGMWGFYLVQSLFCLAGGVSSRPSHPEVDPFDRARSQLLALLD
jgi:hypothetical protein